MNSAESEETTRFADGWSHRLFNDELVDLGDYEDKAFRGVMTPRGELGQKRKGVNKKFLESAETYYKRHQGFDYWRSILNDALGRIDAINPEIIVEYGCGFGNATLPMLNIFQNSKVIASDISPNLLAILKRLLIKRGLDERCVPVAMDAHEPYVKETSADIVFGAAILHHLAEPERLIASALRVLKPGGSAIFFEPLEAGQVVLQTIFKDVLKEADLRSPLNRFLPQFYLIKRMERSLRPQILRQEYPGWRDLDDKWAFPRDMLQKIAAERSAEIRIDAIHDNVGQFKSHFLNLLYMNRLRRIVKPSSYPSWVWDIFDAYDARALASGQELALEGCIIFTKQ